MVKEQVKQVKAVARTIRISPQKLNLVAETIRGLKVNKALDQLFKISTLGICMLPWWLRW